MKKQFEQDRESPPRQLLGGRLQSAPPMQLAAGPEEKGPGQWVKVNEAMSTRAAEYQTKITGKPRGWAYQVDGVKFDGYENGKLLEAKSGMDNFVAKDGRFHTWFKGQAGYQARACQ